MSTKRSLGILLFLLIVTFAMPALGATTVVSPGTGTLRTAIGAASSGDTLILQTGTYVETATITVNVSLTITGQGRPVIQAGADHVFFFNTPSGVHLNLENLTFDGNDKSGIYGIYGLGTGKVSNCVFQDLYYGVYASNNWTITGNTFTMISGALNAIEITNATDALISGNTVYMPNPWGRCLYFNNSHGAITSNTFSTDQLQMMEALAIRGTSVATVTNNIITGFGVGIQVMDTAVVTARNNYLAANTYAIVNGATSPIDAKYNFWGTTDPVAIASLVSGSVTTTYPLANGGPQGLQGPAGPSGNRADIIDKLAEQANGGLSLQQNTGEAASAVKFAIKDATGNVKSAFTADGTLGVGTTTPVKSLQVESAGQTSLLVRGATGYGGAIEFQNMTIPTAKGNWLGGFFFGAAHTGTTTYNAVEVTSFADGPWISGSSYPSGVLFKTVASGATVRSERMRINSAGNVGIGSSSPTQKLEVNGNVKATAFIGDGSQLTNLPINTGASRPECTSSNRGTFWYSAGDDGIQDSVAVCVKDALNAYDWKTLSY